MANYILEEKDTLEALKNVAFDQSKDISGSFLASDDIIVKFCIILKCVSLPVVLNGLFNIIGSICKINPIVFRLSYFQ